MPLIILNSLLITTSKLFAVFIFSRNSSHQCLKNVKKSLCTKLRII